MTSASALRILLIDDNPLVREALAAMLTSDGHTVLPAAGGREGLARLEAGEAVDLVLTDLKMPGLSGWEVVRAVKARWPHVPVAVITGTPEALLRQRGEPIDLVIFKPVTLDALREAISRFRAGQPPPA